MAKKEGSIGGLLPILGLIIIGIIITLVSNIFNFPLLITYGPGQYVSNIWQGHSDFYGKAKSNFKIYEKRPEVNAIFHGHSLELLKPGIVTTEEEKPYGTVELVEEVLKVLDNDVFVLKNHGFVSLGKTMDEAGNNIVKLLRTS